MNMVKLQSTLRPARSAVYGVKSNMGGRIIGILLSIALAVTACDTASAAAEPDGTLKQEDRAAQEPVNREFEAEFTSMEIPDEIFERMAGKSYGEDCAVPREELRYLRLSYVGFDGLPHTGEMVANRSIAEALIGIFQKLYEAGYPIERMDLIDNYDGDDVESMEANNTSCFNFRKISGSDKLSKHSRGMAVDVNPLYNPYVKKQEGKLLVEPACSAAYTDRAAVFPHKIEAGDLMVTLFKEAGFSWGGDWKSVKDYQHFEWNE